MATIQHIVCLLTSIHITLAFTEIYREDVNATNYQDVVRLGGLFSLHSYENGQCGLLRVSLVERVEAMVYAIQEINKDPSILPGVNLTFDIRTTCSNRDRALAEALNYVHDPGSSDLPVSAIMGPAFSDSSILVASILNLFEIPQISYTSTAAALSDKSRYGYFFRTIPSDALQSRVIANLIQEFGWTYIFAFYSADPYGEGGISSLEEELNAANGTTAVCLALKISLPLAALRNNSEFDDAVHKMNVNWVRNASVAVIFGHFQQAEGMFSAIERLLKVDPRSPLDNITWIAPDSWALILKREFYQRARGMLAVHPHYLPIPDFSEYFFNLTLNSTRNPWFREYWELTYGCSLSGSSNKPCNLTMQMLPRNMTLISEPSQVIQGIYAFAVAIHNTINTYCPNTTLCERVLETRSNGGKAINGKILREQLLNVSLSNVPLVSSKGLLFDRNGDIQSFSYTIYNLRTDSSGELAILPVGYWDHKSLLNIRLADIQWRKVGGTPRSMCSLLCGLGEEPVGVAGQAQCCWTCRRCLGEFTVSTGNQCQECKENFIPNSDKSICISVPLKYLTWSSPFGILIAILLSFGILICILTGGIYAVFFNNPVIKASSRELSIILLCGILFCYCLPLLYLIKPTPATCAVLRICSGVCFATVFSPLVVKTNRIHRIFKHVKISNSLPRFVSPTSQIVITLLLMSIQVVIASVWLAAQPPGVKTVLVSRRFLELVCDHNPHVALIVTVMYNLFLLGIAAFFAFRTRKLPEHFNESKFISTTVFSLCVVWIAFVPTFYILTTIEEGLQLQTFSLLVTIILSASITLCCLLIPKVFMVFSLKFRKDTIDTVSGKIRKSSTITTDK